MRRAIMFLDEFPVAVSFRIGVGRNDLGRQRRATEGWPDDSCRGNQCLNVRCARDPCVVDAERCYGRFAVLALT